MNVISRAAFLMVGLLVWTVSGCAGGSADRPVDPGSGAGRESGASAAVVPTPWPNPSIAVEGKPVRTGLRIGEEELVLALDSERNLWTSWWNIQTQRYDRMLDLDDQTRRAAKRGGPIARFEVRELAAPDGRLLTYGYALTHVDVATIVQDDAPRVSTAVRPYNGSQEVTLFWVMRRGVSMSKDVPDDKRAVCALYRQDGTVIDHLVLKEDDVRPQDG